MTTRDPAPGGGAPRVADPQARVTPPGPAHPATRVTPTPTPPLPRPRPTPRSTRRATVPVLAVLLALAGLGATSTAEAEWPLTGAPPGAQAAQVFKFLGLADKIDDQTDELRADLVLQVPAGSVTLDNAATALAFNYGFGNRTDGRADRTLRYIKTTGADGALAWARNQDERYTIHDIIHSGPNDYLVISAAGDLNIPDNNTSHNVPGGGPVTIPFEFRVAGQTTRHEVQVQAYYGQVDQAARSGPYVQIVSDNSYGLWSERQANWGQVLDYGFSYGGANGAHTDPGVLPANSQAVAIGTTAFGGRSRPTDTGGIAKGASEGPACSVADSFWYAWVDEFGGLVETVTPAPVHIRGVTPTNFGGNRGWGNYAAPRTYATKNSRTQGTPAPGMVGGQWGQPTGPAMNPDGSIDFRAANAAGGTGYYRLLAWPESHHPGAITYDGGAPCVTYGPAGPDLAADRAAAFTVGSVFYDYHIPVPPPPVIDYPTPTSQLSGRPTFRGTGLPNHTITLALMPLTGGPLVTLVDGYLGVDVVVDEDGHWSYPLSEGQRLTEGVAYQVFASQTEHETGYWLTSAQTVVTTAAVDNSGPAAGESDLVVWGPTGETAPLEVGHRFTAEVTVRSADRRPLAGVTVRFEANPKPGAPADAVAELSEPACVTGPGGACRITLSSAVVAEYELRASLADGAGGQADVPVRPAGVGAVRATADEPVRASADEPVRATADEPVHGSPADVGFKAGPVCLANCTPVDPSHLSRVEVTRDGATADGTDADQATLWAYDRFGNPVEVTWEAATADPRLTVVTATGVTAADGTAQLTFTSRYPGTHQADVTIGGAPVPGAPLDLSFAAGAPDRVTLSVAPLAVLPAGGEFQATAHAVDAAGGDLAGVAVAFQTTAGLAFADADQCVTGDDGRCSVAVTSTRAGAYEVAATYGAGTPLDDSPQPVVFEAGPVCVAGCSPDDPAHTTRAEVVRNGAHPDGADRDVVQVWAYDAYGNPVAGAAVTATPDPAASSTLAVQPAIAPTGADGTTTVWFTSTRAGTFPADLTVAGLVPDGSPADLGFGSGLGDPAHSSFRVEPQVPGSPTPLVAGDGPDSTYQAVAEVRDVFGDPVAGAVVTFGVDPPGPEWGGGDYACTTGADGTCLVTLWSAVAGPFAVTADLVAGPIGSAQPVAWRAGPICGADCAADPGVPPDRLTRAEVTVDRQTADGVAEDQVTVWAFDRFGNPVAGAAVAGVPAGPDLAIAPGVPPTDAAGTAAIALTSTVARGHALDVTVGGARPHGAPVTATFVAGPPDPGHSTLAAAPPVQAAGADVTVTVTLADRFGNRVTGLPEAAFDLAGVAAGGGPGLAFGGFADRGDGTYEFTTSSSTADLYTLSGAVSGLDLAQRPEVRFTAAGVCATNCQATDPARRTRAAMTVNDQVADGVARDEAAVWAFDTYGNPVEGAAVVAVHGGGTLTPDHQTVTTDAAGRATLGWTSAVVGAFAADITVDGLTGFPGSALDAIRFAPSGVSPGDSDLVVTPPAGETPPIEVGHRFTATVTVRDAQRHPLPGVPVTFAGAPVDAPAGAALDVSEPVCTSGADGTCAITLTAVLAGTYQLHATVPADGAPAPVRGSPQLVRFGADAGASPSPSPDVTPSVTPSASPGVTPSASPGVTPSAGPSTTPRATPTTSPAPTVTRPPTPSVTPPASAPPGIPPGNTGTRVSPAVLCWALALAAAGGTLIYLTRRRR
jgi:hypothetical protein